MKGQTQMCLGVQDIQDVQDVQDAHMGPNPHGPRPTWVWEQMGLGPHGPGPTGPHVPRPKPQLPSPQPYEKPDIWKIRRQSEFLEKTLIIQKNVNIQKKTTRLLENDSPPPE